MSIEQPSLLQGMEIRPEFVVLDIDADTDVGAIEILAKNLLENGVVKPGFLPAILKREEEYCTGLAFEEMGIAIPHTDAEHVNQASIAIGVLKKPVTFKSMGMPNIPCEVEMLFMLAIKEPHTQLDFLKTLMLTFQTSGRLQSLKDCKTPREMVDTFTSYFTE